MDWKQEILKRLDALADKLGTTAAYLWAVLIRQAKIEAITDILWIVLVIGIVYGVVRWTINYYTRHDELMDGEPKEGIPLVVAWIIGAICIGFGIACLFELPTLILNPEYWALQQILNK